MLAAKGGDTQGDEQVLLNWLKKDSAKHEAAVEAIGVELSSPASKGRVANEVASIASATAGLFALVAEAVLSPTGVEDIHRPVELLDTRNPVTRDWFASDRFGIRDF